MDSLRINLFIFISYQIERWKSNGFVVEPTTIALTNQSSPTGGGGPTNGGGGV